MFCVISSDMLLKSPALATSVKHRSPGVRKLIAKKLLATCRNLSREGPSGHWDTIGPIINCVIGLV